MTAITPDQPLPPAPESRNFILFSVAQCVSFAGDWMQKAAVGWLAWDLTHSPAWVGAVALSDLIAAFWVAPLAGAIADRSNPYKLIWTTQVLAMINSCAIWALSSGSCRPGSCWPGRSSMQRFRASTSRRACW